MKFKNYNNAMNMKFIVKINIVLFIGITLFLIFSPLVADASEKFIYSWWDGYMAETIMKIWATFLIVIYNTILMAVLGKVISEDVKEEINKRQ